jgi:hypothetical protein
MLIIDCLLLTTFYFLLLATNEREGTFAPSLRPSSRFRHACKKYFYNLSVRPVDACECSRSMPELRPTSRQTACQQEFVRTKFVALLAAEATKRDEISCKLADAFYFHVGFRSIALYQDIVQKRSHSVVLSYTARAIVH